MLKKYGKLIIFKRNKQRGKMDVEKDKGGGSEYLNCNSKRNFMGKNF